jgi:hypothetical protein
LALVKLATARRDNPLPKLVLGAKFTDGLDITIVDPQPKPPPKPSVVTKIFS